MLSRFAYVTGLVLSAAIPMGVVSAQENQYDYDTIEIPPARADEPKLEHLSVSKALEYLDKGSTAWTGSQQCITCHTNGMYMMMRPMLTPTQGPPDEEFRKQFVELFNDYSKQSLKEQQASGHAAGAVISAAGLASWDANVTHKLSPETELALSNMLNLQRDSGTWRAADSSPPFESSAYQLATVAALAIGNAPGWLENLKDEDLLARVERLKIYLRTETPALQYDQVLALWVESRLPGLITAERKKELVDLIFSKQLPDGGWSIRMFGQPEQWGFGQFAKKLREEPEFGKHTSDGHMTGLAMILLREAGIPANDPRLQKGVHWLQTNQQESGRWWTRSLKSDEWHFLTYSGTAYPLLALQLCGTLPPSEVKAASR